MPPPWRSILLLLLATGCDGSPPRAAPTSFGEVVAADPGQATAVAAAVKILLPALRQRLPDAAEGALQVVVQGPRLEPAPGRLAPPQILGRYQEAGPGLGRILLVEHWQPEALAHELVHALLGPGWEALPPALEEGLADTLAVEVLAARWPDQAEVIRDRRRRWLGQALAGELSAAGALALPASALRGHSPEEELARVLGFLLARSLHARPDGLTWLAGTCRRAAGDPAPVARAVLAAVGEDWRRQAEDLRRRGR